MDESPHRVDSLLTALRERAKELNCLYRVDEILTQSELSNEEIGRQLVAAIPAGWVHVDICQAEILLEGAICRSEDYRESPWRLVAPIVAEGNPLGEIAVSYTEPRPEADEGPFLKQERRLIHAIAERVGLYVSQRRLRRAHHNLVQALEQRDTPEWRVILQFLRRTDQKLLVQLTRRMINHVYSIGVDQAQQLLQEFVTEDLSGNWEQGDENRPQRRGHLLNLADLADRTFAIAAEHCTDDELIGCIRSWMEEDKASFLMEVLEDPASGLAEIVEALQRYANLDIQEQVLPLPLQQSLRVSLLRRLFTDRIQYINVAKHHVLVDDFVHLARRIVYPPRSHGKLGGKSAGLFLAANIVARSPEHAELLGTLRTPKTWYVSSDGILSFVHYNNLEDLYNRKYEEIERIRQEYPHIVQIFKNSRFPPEMVTGLSAALDDFDDSPLIVRSSSLLEDQSGATFSGKYKSLFLANRGTKRERLLALQDAIAEVYASVFGPDPIEYRAERGLLDVHEEMAVMIQAVVGKSVGRYFFPAYAGVAFSNNEFRWSPRIRRDDGLIRLVAGLGTRAVDRVGEDYPVLVAPGQPTLRVNVTTDEVIRYSPRRIDVINLESNSFETVEVNALLREFGDDYPAVRDIIAMVDQHRLRRPHALEPDWEKDDYVVTFEGVLTQTPFVQQVGTLLNLLRDRLQTPVDVEFAHDGEALYLLQCRAQSHSEEHAPASIPRDLPRDQIVFSARRHVSNGRIPDITHVVYIDPERYTALGDPNEMKQVARCVGRLNKILPKRQFILLGPGRWGSRGDIRLGVAVTYSDINNTAVLLEIAKRTGEFMPELSFGTHFFQDLVEAGIRYLPLYPDEPDVLFNHRFLDKSENILTAILPEFARLAEVVRVIDVSKETGGKILRILMNADLDEAVGVLTTPGPGRTGESLDVQPMEAPPDVHWRWRMRMAERIAAHLDTEAFGVKGLFVFGSAKNATAGPASDIDLLVHFAGDERQQSELLAWLSGWSLALSEVNYLRTGYPTQGLLDVHLVTDDDIANRTSFAVKIDAVTDAARRLPTRPKTKTPEAGSD